MANPPKLNVVITGAESSGKSTLATDLSSHYNVPHVKEFAREFLTTQNSTYIFSDLLTIAKGQQKSIDALTSKEDLVISDTDLLTIKIWSKFKFGKYHRWVVDTHLNSLPDLYLICSHNIPWEEDPLRENPNDRDELYQIYKAEIQKLNVPYTEISGDKEDRLKTAIEAIDHTKTKV